MTAINRKPTTLEQLQRETSTWPEPQARAWQEAHDPVLGCRSWAPESRYTYARVYSRYLATIRNGGFLEGRLTLTPEGLRAFLRKAEVSASMRTLHGYVHQLIEVATVIYPEAIRNGEFDWLYRTRARLYEAASRTPKRRHDMLTTAIDLLWVADTAMLEAHTLSGWKAVQRYRDGLFILLGLYVPERRRALATIDLNQLDLENKTLQFHAHQIKTAEPHLWTLGSGIIDVLREWVDIWRATHVHADVTALFIGKDGRAVGDAALYTSMKILTEEKLDTAISPHILRHTAATTLLETDPDKPDFVSLLLGHRSLQTRDAYTEKANSILASQKLRKKIAAHGEQTAREIRARQSQDGIGTERIKH